MNKDTKEKKWNRKEKREKRKEKTTGVASQY